MHKAARRGGGAQRAPLFVIILTIALAGCGNNPAQAPAAGSGTAPDAGEYIEVSALAGLEYFYDHRMGLERAGEYFGVKTRYLSPPDYDINAMITALEQAIALRPAGILVVGFEESLVPFIDKAVDEGIPVVTLDSDLPASKRLAFIGTGNYRAGHTGGKKLGELIGGKGKVALLTLPGQPNLEERIRGYRDALAEFSGIQIVQVSDSRSDPAIAAQAAAAVLQKHPDLAGFGCVETVGGVGAATAVREAGREGAVRIVAMDRSNDVLQGIRDGIISASVAQQTALMPFYGVEVLRARRRAGLAISNDNERAGVPGLPAFIDTGIIMVTPENCEYFFR